MKPLKITAILQNGFSSAFDWSPSIDGIIAYQFMQEKLGSDVFHETHGIISEQKPVTGLPLAVEEFEGDWWYQCSRPIYKTAAIHKTHLHRRFNAAEAEVYSSSKTGVIQTTKGPFKNARMTITKRITGEVVWHVIGDKSECERLLNKVTHIGSQRRSGFGAVKKWVVSEDGNTDIARFNRPLPLAFAEQHGVTGFVIKWAVRPPYALAENMRECVISGIT